jgi:hypothetical protein
MKKWQIELFAITQNSYICAGITVRHGWWLQRATFKRMQILQRALATSNKSGKSVFTSDDPSPITYSNETGDFKTEACLSLDLIYILVSQNFSRECIFNFEINTS